MKGINQWIEQVMDDPKKRRIIIVIGLVFIGILFLSSFFPLENASKKKDEANSIPTVTSEEYAERLEEKLEQALSNVKGAGRVQVTLTLKNGEEIVYQSDTKKETDQTAASEERNEYREELQQEVVLIEGEDGETEALTRTVLPPTVQGVLVVCEGAGDIRVEKAVIDAATALFSLNSTQVAVAEYEVTDSNLSK